MLRPGIFIIVLSIALLTGATAFYIAHTAPFLHSKNKIGQQVADRNRPAKNITVIFLDITDSDTGKAWTSQPFREQFVKAVNTCFTNSRDILAAYLIHGKTRDVQPFWTNYPLSSPPTTALDDSASLISAGSQKEQCIEAFDAIASGRLLLHADALDSMLTGFTDVMGAFQQAALYFRDQATAPGDVKRVFFLSDTKENAGFTPNSVKLNNIGSIATARVLADNALKQVRQATDIKDELRYADIYLLSPNNHLYYNEERNLRRVFWEALLIDHLHCTNVHYF